MELITERLVISKFTESDKELWQHIEKDFEVRKYIDQKTLSRVEAANYVRDIIESYSANGYGRYAVRDKANFQMKWAQILGIDIVQPHGVEVLHMKLPKQFFFWNKNIEFKPSCCWCSSKEPCVRKNPEKTGISFSKRGQIHGSKILEI